MKKFDFALAFAMTIQFAVISSSLDKVTTVIRNQLVKKAKGIIVKED